MSDDENKASVGGRDSFQAYIKQWTNHALLTKEQEYDLIREAQQEERDRQAKIAEAKRQIKNGSPPPSRPAKASKAMTALIGANVRLLLTYAQRYSETGRRRGVFREDLFTIASLGLQRAVLKFDFSMDCRLTTYASWWIRQEMSRAVQDLGSTVRIPTHVAERGRKLRRIIARYRTEFGRDPDNDTLCHLSGFTADQVQRSMTAPAEPSSLNKPVDGSDASGGTPVMLIDVVTDAEHETKTPEADMLRAQQKSRLVEAMGKFLRPTEREVLRCRFIKDLTLTETAAALAKPDCAPLSRERIRQIETAALKKLRAALR